MPVLREGLTYVEFAAGGVVAFAITAPASPWIDLGQSLPGSSGEPTLAASGDLTPSSAVSLTLTHALPAAAAWIVASPFELNAPFMGGILVPDPRFVVALAADSSGSIELTFPVPAGLVSGSQLFLQYWIPDPGALQKFSASNALQLSVP